MATCLVAPSLTRSTHLSSSTRLYVAGAIYPAVPHAPEISTSLSFFHRVLLTQNLISLGASSGLTRYFVVNIKMDNLCSAAGIQIVDTSCYSNNDLIQLVQMKLFSLNKINDAPNLYKSKEPFCIYSYTSNSCAKVYFTGHRGLELPCFFTDHRILLPYCTQGQN